MDHGCCRTVVPPEDSDQANFEKMSQNQVIEPGHSARCLGRHKAVYQLYIVNVFSRACAPHQIEQLSRVENHSLIP